MRPGTRCNGRNYSSLCPIRGQCFGTARHIGSRLGRDRANGPPSLHPRALLLSGIHGRAGSHWPGPDNIAAVDSRTDDGSRRRQGRRHCLRSWHWFRLSGRSTSALSRLEARSSHVPWVASPIQRSKSSSRMLKVRRLLLCSTLICSRAASRGRPFARECATHSQKSHCLKIEHRSN